MSPGVGCSFKIISLSLSRTKARESGKLLRGTQEVTNLRDLESGVLHEVTLVLSSDGL